MERVFPPQYYAGQLGGARPQEKGFAASTAAAAGMTKQAINQHLARADALGDDLERIKGTSITRARVEGTQAGRVFSQLNTHHPRARGGHLARLAVTCGFRK